MLLQGSRSLLSAVTALLLIGVMAHGAVASCPRGSYNEKICSGHGSCNTMNQCVCDSRHTGFDCSQNLCPRGSAWFHAARATDDAHFDAECSNRGHCERQTGRCICMEGYTGSACQRLACHQNCNDGGECISLKQLSKMYAVGTEPIYDQVWDAEMLYGCNCRKGFHEYDCSKRSCPRGDDPMTTGQVNEVQFIQCTGKAGSFQVFFNGQGATVPFDATEAQVARILKSIPTLPVVKVTFTAGVTTVCSSMPPNPIAIEFTEEFGPQPPFKVFASYKGVTTLQGGDVYAAAGGASLANRMSVRGTKEWAVCSNRGDCDTHNGQCVCFVVPMPGFRSSDGYGNPGIRGDCGCANNQNKYGGAIKACPGELACSGHGYCTGAPSFRCVCEQGWTNGDCSARSCPQGPTWFGVPSASNVVHTQYAECSNAGICDRGTGECQCYSPFTGDACNFLKCPGEPACSGHGQCMSIRQMSLEADVNDPSLRFDYGTDPNNALTYDRDSVLGCKCDPSYHGYDCSRRACPRGDDPTTTGQVDEIQVLRCLGIGGQLQLQYRTSTSPGIPFNASPGLLRSILMASFGFEEVIVEYSFGQSLCSSATAATINLVKLTFPIDHGDLPPLRGISSSLLSDAVAPTTPLAFADNGVALGGVQSQQGTKEFAVCSNKGICNEEHGICECTAGYGSSDGRGSFGNRGDCGFRLPKFVSTTS